MIVQKFLHSFGKIIHTRKFDNFPVLPVTFPNPIKSQQHNIAHRSLKIISFEDPDNTYVSFDESISDLDLPVNNNQEAHSLEDLIEMEREYIDLNEDSFCSNDFSDEELYSRAVKETDDNLERLKSELLELKL